MALRDLSALWVNPEPLGLADLVPEGPLAPLAPQELYLLMDRVCDGGEDVERSFYRYILRTSFIASAECVSDVSLQESVSPALLVLPAQQELQDMPTL